MSLEKLHKKLKSVFLGGNTVDWVALGEFLDIWEDMSTEYLKDFSESVLPIKFAKMRDVQRAVTGLTLSPMIGRKVIIDTFSDDVRKEIGI